MGQLPNVNVVNPFAGETSALAGSLGQPIRGGGSGAPPSMAPQFGLEAAGLQHNQAMGQGGLSLNADQMTQSGMLQGNQAAMMQTMADRKQIHDQAFGRLTAKREELEGEYQEIVQMRAKAFAEQDVQSLEGYQAELDRIQDNMSRITADTHQAAVLQMLMQGVYEGSPEMGPDGKPVAGPDGKPLRKQGLQGELYGVIQEALLERAQNTQQRLTAMGAFVEGLGAYAVGKRSRKIPTQAVGDIPLPVDMADFWAAAPATQLLGALGGTNGPNGQVAADTQAKLSKWFADLTKARQAVSRGGDRTAATQSLIQSQAALRQHLGQETFNELVHGLSTAAIANDRQMEMERQRLAATEPGKLPGFDQIVKDKKATFQDLREMMTMAVGMRHPGTEVRLPEIIPVVDKDGKVIAPDSSSYKARYDNLITRTLAKLYDMNPAEAIQLIEGAKSTQLKDDFGRLIADRMKSKVENFATHMDQQVQTMGLSPMDAATRGLRQQNLQEMTRQAAREKERVDAKVGLLRDPMKKKAAEAAALADATQKIRPRRDQAELDFLKEMEQLPPVKLPYSPADLAAPKNPNPYGKQKPRRRKSNGFRRS